MNYFKTPETTTFHSPLYPDRLVHFRQEAEPVIWAEPALLTADMFVGRPRHEGVGKNQAVMKVGGKVLRLVAKQETAVAAKAMWVGGTGVEAYIEPQLAVGRLTRDICRPWETVAKEHLGPHTDLSPYEEGTLLLKEPPEAVLADLREEGAVDPEMLLDVMTDFMLAQVQITEMNGTGPQHELLHPAFAASPVRVVGVVARHLAQHAA